MAVRMPAALPDDEGETRDRLAAEGARRSTVPTTLPGTDTNLR